MSEGTPEPSRLIKAYRFARDHFDDPEVSGAAVVILAILQLVVPMTIWLKLGLLVLACGFAVNAIWRAAVTRQWSRAAKQWGTVVAVGFFAAVGAYTFLQQSDDADIALRVAAELERAKANTEKPQVGIHLIGEKEVSIAITNESKTAIVRDFVYTTILCNLNAPEADKFKPLPIATRGGGFVRPGEQSRSNVWIGEVTPLLKAGDRLLGTVVVTCPECVRSRQYLVYVEHGVGGWYFEIPFGLSDQGLQATIDAARRDIATLANFVQPSQRTKITND